LSLAVPYSSSDQDLQSFFFHLKDLVTLRSLKINFSTLKDFSFESANLFIEAMKKLEKLHNLNLMIGFEIHLVQEVQLFISGISQLKSLTTLNYCFGRIETLLSMHNIVYSWRQIKTLKTLLYADDTL